MLFILFVLFSGCMNLLIYFVYFFSADSNLVTTPRPLSLLGRASGLSGLPGPPQGLEAVITSTRFMTLAWEAPTKDTVTITGYSVYYQQQGSER